MNGKRKKDGPLFKRIFPRFGKRGGAHKRAATLIAVLGVVLMSLSFVSAPAQASGGGGGDNDGKLCAPLDSGKIDTTGDPQTVTVTAPEGKLIDGYCVKAGSANQGDGPVYVTVDPPVKTLTFGYPGGKAVSHYSLSYTDEDVCTDIDGNQPSGTDCTQPPDDRETRDLPGVVDCESDTYTVQHQERTREYSWDGDSWEPGPWSDWTTYDTTVTPATEEQCPTEENPEGSLTVSKSCESITFSASGVKPEDAQVVIKLDGVDKAAGTYTVTPGSHTVDLYVNGEKVDSKTVTVEQCPAPPGCAGHYQDENPQAECYVSRQPVKRVESGTNESCKLGGVETTTTVYTTTYSFNEGTQAWESSDAVTSSKSFAPYTAAQLKAKGCKKKDASAPTGDNNPPKHHTNPTGLTGAPHTALTGGEQGRSWNAPLFGLGLGLVGVALRIRRKAGVQA